MKPIIQTNDDGTVVEVTWSPPFEGPLLTKHPAHEVADFYDAYIAFAQSIQEWKDLHIVHRLFSGDILTFNNRRMLHGRQAFSPNGGRRHLRVSLCSIMTMHSICTYLFRFTLLL